VTPSPWLTIEESMVYLRRDHLKTARVQVLKLFRDGKIKTVKDGRRYLTTAKWLESYLTKRDS
jgi:hypothetical protein